MHIKWTKKHEKYKRFGVLWLVFLPNLINQNPLLTKILLTIILFEYLHLIFFADLLIWLNKLAFSTSYVQIKIYERSIKLFIKITYTNVFYLSLKYTLPEMKDFFMCIKCDFIVTLNLQQITKFMNSSFQHHKFLQF